MFTRRVLNHCFASKWDSTEFPTATVLVGAVGTSLDFFVFFFEREISLRERTRSILSWMISFISEVLTQCSLREAGFSRGVKGLLGQAVHVLEASEERTPTR